MQFLIGIILAALIGLVGYQRRSLSRSGVVGAIITGGLIFGFGGFSGGALLLAFFISSSVLSHFKESQKEALAEKFSKGSQRDLGQALANGGLAAACALAWGLTGWPGWWAAMAAALAAANADTWATELGVLNRTAPRLITTWQPVEAGTSGGVSAGGTLAALAGAGLIGLTAGLAVLLDPGLAVLRPWMLALVLLVSVAGLAASLFDSLLGATGQAIYWCDACGRETERHPLHRCGSATRQVRGLAWLDNDWVNFLATVAGAGLGALAWWLSALH